MPIFERGLLAAAVAALVLIYAATPVCADDVVPPAPVSSVAPAAPAADAALAAKVNELMQQLQKQQTQIQDLAAKLATRNQQVDNLETQVDQLKKAQAAAPAPKQAQATTPAPKKAPVKKEAAKNPAQAPAKATVQKASTLKTASNSPANGGLQHVGQAPTENDKPPPVPVLANVGGVLTPYGKVVVEPFVQYSRSSVDTFAFNGVQIIPAFLVGNITATKNAQDIVESGATFRVGATDRLELEAKIPFIWRQDSLTNSVGTVTTPGTTTTSTGYGLGDVEVAAHYQVNDGKEDWPFFIANMRFKTDTGTSPYDANYNSNGLATTLPTGSGFMAVEPSVTAIYPLDPATLFANVGYIHSFDKDINKSVAGNAIGNVAPGDTYLASVGMGIALNDRLSLTLGYEQDYVSPTTTVVGGVPQDSESLMVGSALTGFSLKVNDRVSVNLNLAAGVTRDAPDTQVTLRVPIQFSAF